MNGMEMQETPSSLALHQECDVTDWEEENVQKEEEEMKSKLDSGLLNCWEQQ